MSRGSGFFTPDPEAHRNRAAELLEAAAAEVRAGGVDQIPTVSEALANLHAEAGELPPEVAEDLLELADAGDEEGQR
jgi:hypothetical protein